LWLSKAITLADVNKRPWLRDLVRHIFNGPQQRMGRHHLSIISLRLVGSSQHAASRPPLPAERGNRSTRQWRVDGLCRRAGCARERPSIALHSKGRTRSGRRLHCAGHRGGWAKRAAAAAQDGYSDAAPPAPKTRVGTVPSFRSPGCIQPIVAGADLRLQRSLRLALGPQTAGTRRSRRHLG
jgi:hypothetical protein